MINTDLHSFYRIFSWSFDNETAYLESYAKHTQDELVYEIERMMATDISNAYWVYAMRQYILRFPLCERIQKWRKELGAAWLLHIRRTDDDWVQIIHDPMLLTEQVYALLSELPVHPEGLAYISHPDHAPELFIGEEAYEWNVRILECINKYKHYLLNPKHLHYGATRLTLLVFYFNIDSSPSRKSQQEKLKIEIQKTRLTTFLGCTSRQLENQLLKGLSPVLKDTMLRTRPKKLKEARTLLTAQQ